MNCHNHDLIRLLKAATVAAVFTSIVAGAIFMTRAVPNLLVISILAALFALVTLSTYEEIG